jgi:type II secretion system protein H
MHKDTTGIMVRSDWPRCDGEGFTLVELLIVIVILGVAAAIAVPLASAAANLQLRSAVNMLAADLEYAKSQAIGTGQRHGVVFDIAAQTYRIVNASGDTIAHPVKKGFPYIVNFSGDARLGQVTIAQVDFDGTSTVSFDYLGSPYNSASALDSGSVTLRAGGVDRTVSVEAVTGFISISE